MKIARIAVLFALARFGSASAEVECQAADYGSVCPSNGDDIAGMHMSLLQTGQHMRSGTEPDVVKDVQDVLVAKAVKGQEKAAIRRFLLSLHRRKLQKLSVKAPEKAQPRQFMSPGTEHDGLKEVQDWLEGAAAKAKVAAKAQGTSLLGQQMSAGREPEDLKEVQDVLEGAAAKAAKFAVKAQEKAQPELKDKADAARVKAGKSMEDATKALEASFAKLALSPALLASEASLAKPALKTTRSKDDTTDVVTSPVGGRIKQDMKIASLPHNARHYDKFADPPPKIWPCEYPSMKNCQHKPKNDDSAASPLIATGFCSFAVLAVFVL